MPFEWGLRRTGGMSFCEELLTTPWEDFYLLLFETASLTTATTEMFITWWSVYLISDLLSTLKFPASPSIANFRNDENWKPDRAWEMYHVRSLESPRVQITSSLKYLFLFMGTPEHGRGLQRLRSKLWPGWTCAWGVLPKVQLQGSTRRRLYVWFKGNPCCFRPIINIMKSLGMIKCCFFQHYFDGQKIILGCKQSLFLD